MSLKGLLALLVAIAAWEGLYRAGLLNPLLIAAPSLIVEAAMKDGWTFLSALQVTAFEIVVAGALAWSIGVAAGVLLGAELATAVAISPFLSAAIAVPLVVLYPVIVAMAGIGPPSKIIYGALAGVFPIALTTVSGVSSIDRRFVTLGRAIGASRLQMLAQVMSRLALPSIVSGLRVGTSLVIIAVVQSEMLSSTSGIGFLISYHRSLFHAGHVYLGILLVVLIAMLANALLRRIDV